MRTALFQSFSGLTSTYSISSDYSGSAVLYTLFLITTLAVSDLHLFEPLHSLLIVWPHNLVRQSLIIGFNQ